MSIILHDPITVPAAVTVVLVRVGVAVVAVVVAAVVVAVPPYAYGVLL